MKTQHLFEQVLDIEKPDLVVLTGDVLSGDYKTKGKNDWRASSLWKLAVDPMIERNIPWCFVLGNHDAEGDYSKDQLVAFDTSFGLSLTQRGPREITGYTNYFLPVNWNLENDKSVAMNLWFLDSGDYYCEGVFGYGCVTRSQVEWFKNVSKSQTQPTLMFFHIPPPEMIQLYTQFKTQGHLWDEGICCWPKNTGLFHEILQKSNIRGVFVGHDHSNDFIGLYHDILLGYGRKSGYGTYGPKATLPGARVIEISFSPGMNDNEDAFYINTWIREDGGNMINDQPLHYPWLGSTKFECCKMDDHRKAVDWGILLGFQILFALLSQIVVCLIQIRRFRTSNEPKRPSSPLNSV